MSRRNKKPVKSPAKQVPLPKDLEAIIIENNVLTHNLNLMQNTPYKGSISHIVTEIRKYLEEKILRLENKILNHEDRELVPNIDTLIKKHETPAEKEKREAEEKKAKEDAAKKKAEEAKALADQKAADKAAKCKAPSKEEIQ